MALRNLPYHAMQISNGLNTNFTPEAIAGMFLTTAQNVDGYDIFQGLSKIPGSTRVSDDHGSAVVSLHQFEYTGLDRVRARKQLSLAGGTLYRIDSDKSINSLKTGLTSEALSQAIMLDRLHLTSANQRGLVTGGIKYDGNTVTNWGCLAPGDTITVQQALDVHTNWTDSADATSSTNSTNSQDGTASVQVDKDGTGSAEASISRAGLSLDWSNAGQDTAYINLFVPAGGLQSLTGSSMAVRITIGNAGLGNSDEHDFTVGDLAPGWNLLSFVLTSPTSTNGSGANLSSIDTVKLELTAATAGTTFTGFLWDQLYITDEGAVTHAEGAAGNPSGTYTYRVTFLTEYGLESNAGPASTSRTVTSKQIDLSAIPTSSDTQVIARRIYRDISGDGLYRFVAQIDDNTTTTYSDDIADASLGTATAPFAGDATFDNSPPGRFYDCAVHANRVIGVSADDRFTLVISEASQPEAFRIVDQLQIEEEITALESHVFGLIIYATDKVFLFTGDGITTSFRIEEVSTELGANGKRSVARVKGIHVAIREQQMFLVVNPSDPWFLNGPVYDQFLTLSDADLADAHVLHDRSRFRIVLFAKGDGSAVYNKVFVYQYGTMGKQQITGEGSGTDPQDLRQGGWFTMELPTSIDPQCSAAVERTADLPELWVGGGDGYVYYMQDPAAATWAENTGTAAIDAQIEFAAVPIGADLGGRGEPRFLKANAEATAQTDWTGTVTLLSDADGASIASNSFTLTIGSGNTSPIIALPSAGDRGEWCRIKLANATAAGVGRFRSVQLFYIPRTDFRGPRSS